MSDELQSVKEELEKWRSIADDLASTLHIDYSGPKPRIKVDIEAMLSSYQRYHQEIGTDLFPKGPKQGE